MRIPYLIAKRLRHVTWTVSHSHFRTFQ